MAPIVRADHPVLINVTVLDDQGEGWRVTLMADGDLIGPGTSIPIDEITWTAVPSPPFIDGRLSRDTPQVIAQGFGTVKSRGTLIFELRDRWDYYPGDYHQTLNFVLSSP